MVIKTLSALAIILFVTITYQLSGQIVDIECQYNEKYDFFALELDSKRNGFFSGIFVSRALRLHTSGVVYEEAVWEKWGADLAELEQLNAHRIEDRYLIEMNMASGRQRTLGHISQQCKNELDTWVEKHPITSQNWHIDKD